MVLYHGTIKEREALRRKHLTINNKKPVQELFPVIITSYEIAMRDKRFIQNKPWKYLIVDEGHRIKNLNCRLIRYNQYDLSVGDTREGHSGTGVL